MSWNGQAVIEYQEDARFEMLLFSIFYTGIILWWVLAMSFALFYHVTEALHLWGEE